jgi:hypothetical protein
MIKEILTAAGVEYAQGRFITMPKGTHAVYFDDVETETADPVASAGMPRIYHHSITVELYEPAPDDATESAIEAELDARALPWSKQDRYWLKDLQRYQVIYELTYHTKRRN